MAQNAARKEPMSSPFQEQLDQAMASLREQQAKIEGAQQKLRQGTFSARSKDRMVTATVDAQGELGELKFHTNEYRSMAPAELSAALVEVVAAARKQAAAKVAETFQPFLGAGAKLRESMTGGSDFEELFAPLRAMGFAERPASIEEDGLHG
jgi:DNA-binding protein YbaB